MNSSSPEKIILVTGGNGFIGSRVVEALRKQEGVSIISLSKDAIPGHEGNVRHVKADLSKRDACKNIKAIGPIDYVLHLAGRTPSVRSTDEKPEEYVKHNVLASLYLAECLPDIVKGFVYASTIDVYGKPQYLPLREDHPLNSLTYYGASKAAAEKYLSVFFDEKGIPLTILRYSQVYGPGEPVVKAIPKFIEAITQKQKPVLYGLGSELRDYAYIDDVVQATILALNKNLGGTFNISSGQGIRIRDALTMLLQISGASLEPIQKPGIKEAFDLVMDISSAKEKLGYAPSVEIREGLKKEFEFFQIKP
ncbi:MAG: NAD-dependent epimerase/dehydratase family protein [Parcubacteria group bacterium]|nr:NAD-dependent epimerase/dehydratase family protein [Parcubacteria group bacterium]